MGRIRELSPAQIRHLPTGQRGQLTATVAAMALHGLATTSPHLELVLVADGEQATVVADRAMYRPVLHCLRVGQMICVQIRIRDQLSHRLAVERITVPA